MSEDTKLREALRDLCDAVDAVCDSDAGTSIVADSDRAVLAPHARSVLELALQRARDVPRGVEDTPA